MNARPLHEIAEDVITHWGNVSYSAWPYLNAMQNLDKVTDTYGHDTADSIVRYFLANATTWRGEDARRVKAELKGMLR